MNVQQALGFANGSYHVWDDIITDEPPGRGNSKFNHRLQRDSVCYHQSDNKLIITKWIDDGLDCGEGKQYIMETIDFLTSKVAI